MPAAVHPLVLVTVATTMLVSLAALSCCWRRQAAGHCLVRYQPRRPVPWGPLAALCAILLPSAAVLLLVPDLPAANSTADFIYVGWLQSLVKISYVVIGLAWLATFLQADSHDLGLPRSWRETGQDLALGGIACCAALLPIYLVQLCLTHVLGNEATHPLIEQLQNSYSPQLIGVGWGLAVIVAPLYEEFTFRLLFQGWLEKCEDRLRGDPASTPPESQEASSLESARPPAARGWPAILISGIVFGLAHLGHGAAPVPLMLFGIVLGYLYQRTHRLLPSIAAHMTFNAYSMLLLWLQLSSPPTH